MKTLNVKSGALIQPLYSQGDNPLIYPMGSLGAKSVGFNHCKEVIAWMLFQKKTRKYVAFRFPKKVKNKILEECQAVIRQTEDKLKIKSRAKLFRLKGYDSRYFGLELSPKWNKNSVAFFLLLTIIRGFVSSKLKINNIASKDKTHISKSARILKLMEKHGLDILGRKRHANYDYGIVALQAELEKAVKQKKPAKWFIKADSRSKSDKVKTKRYARLRKTYVAIRPKLGKKKKDEFSLTSAI